MARRGLRQVRHEQERAAREGPAHRAAQASLPRRRGERCRRGLRPRHGRPKQHRQVSTSHRLPRSTFHAPLTTHDSLPALLLTTYYSPLTTYHVLLTTAASSAPKLLRRARPGRASSRRATYLARRPPCARCYNADRASGDGGMCRDVESAA